MRRTGSALLLLSAAVAAAGCARSKRTAVPAAPAPRQNETGVASWYGEPYHGRATASGEIYDMEKLTAAHRTLDFQTRVRVHNLDNRKTVEVRITDRGPFVDGRIIDLSRAAARHVDMIGPGTARVRLEILEGAARGVSQGTYAVQAGAFRDRDNAERLRARMRKKYGAAKVVGSPNGRLWRVVVGPATPLDRAEALAARVRRDGVKDAVAVRLDP